METKCRSSKTLVILGESHSPWVNYLIRKPCGNLHSNQKHVPRFMPLDVAINKSL